MEKVWRFGLLVAFLTVFMPLAVFAEFEIYANEGDPVQLVLNVSDPDGDPVEFRYEAPFDEEGIWYTTWGDDGIHETTVYVSDGVDETPVPVNVVIYNVNRPPLVIGATPETDLLQLTETDEADFSVEVEELDGDELLYQWFLDDELLDETESIATSTTFSLKTDYESEGVHELSVKVHDGTDFDGYSWPLRVLKKNRVPELEVAKNEFVFSETESASIDFAAHDPDGDELDVTISYPLGADNVWETDYDDAGEYEVTITASDGEEEVSATTLLRITERNRPPVLDVVNSVRIAENDSMRITLVGVDPDGDEVQYSTRGAPHGSVLDGNVLTYKPGYDLLAKGDTMRFSIAVDATDGKDTTTEYIDLIVDDRNRGPIIQHYTGVTIKEGEVLTLNPPVVDPDGDAVEISFEGWISENGYQTDYTDAGTHKITILASDDEYVAKHVVYVTVEEVNDPPVIEAIRDYKADEGTELRVPFSVEDTDEVALSVDGLPGNARVESNYLVWSLPYTIVEKSEKKPTFFSSITGFFGFRTGAEETFPVTLTARDSFGATATQEFSVRVYDANVPPEFEVLSPSQETVYAYAGDVLSFNAGAVDQDGDALTYTWKFGWFDSHKGDAVHKRKFTKPGKKRVSVIVSDGTTDVKHTWDVEVVEFTVQRDEPEPIIEVVEEELEEPIAEEKPVEDTKPKLITLSAS